LRAPQQAAQRLEQIIATSVSPDDEERQRHQPKQSGEIRHGEFVRRPLMARR